MLLLNWVLHLTLLTFSQSTGAANAREGVQCHRYFLLAYDADCEGIIWGPRVLNTSVPVVIDVVIDKVPAYVFLERPDFLHYQVRNHVWYHSSLLTAGC